MVQWLRFHTSNPGGADSIPDWRTEIPLAMRCSQKKKKHGELTLQKRMMAVHCLIWKAVIGRSKKKLKWLLSGRPLIYHSN